MLKERFDMFHSHFRFRLLAAVLAAVLLLSAFALGGFDLQSSAQETVLTAKDIKSVKADTVTIVENTHGRLQPDVETTHYIYNPAGLELRVTVTLKNGTVLTGTGGVYYAGVWYEAVRVDFTNVQQGVWWKAGKTYSAKGDLIGPSGTSVLSDTFTYKVSIVKNPFKSVEILPETLIENTHVADWHSSPVWYSIPMPRMRVKLTDGSMLEGDEFGVTYKGLKYQASLIGGDPQASESWKVGNTYSVEYAFGSLRAVQKISIVQTPVSKIEADKQTVYQYTAGYSEFGELDEYKYIFSPKMTVTFKDGSKRVIESGARTVLYEGELYPIVVNKDAPARWTPGEKTITISVLGYSFKYTFKLAALPEAELDRQGYDKMKAAAEELFRLRPETLLTRLFSYLEKNEKELITVKNGVRYASFPASEGRRIIRAAFPDLPANALQLDLLYELLEYWYITYEESGERIGPVQALDKQTGVFSIPETNAYYSVIPYSYSFKGYRKTENGLYEFWYDVVRQGMKFFHVYTFAYNNGKAYLVSSVRRGTAPNAFDEIPEPSGGGSDLPGENAGDINGNGEVDAVDYILLKKLILGSLEPTPEQASRMDVNGDGETDARDYILLKRIVLNG